MEDNLTLTQRLTEILVTSMFKRLLHEWNPALPSDKRLEFFDKLATDTLSAILTAIRTDVERVGYKYNQQYMVSEERLVTYNQAIADVLELIK